MNRRGAIVERRLAAILCADVAGYTRLMHADESGTLRLLSAHREITDRLIAQHGGRIANTAGDSILAEFPSAVEAVRCALEIQERLAAANEEVAEERRVRFRIGVHVGEAMVRDGDLFGAGVNIAARMQSLALPGAVCLSGTAYEFVHKHVALTCEDLGPQAVKNLDAPVRAFLARPSGQPFAPAIPPIHRGNEFNLGRRFHELLRSALKEITGAVGLTAVEPAVLASLQDAPGIDTRRLADRIGVEHAAARRMVARLERLGLVERMQDGGSTRMHGLRLTPAGVTLFLRLHPAILAVRDRIMAPLSEPEREALLALLGRVINANERNAIRDRNPRGPETPPRSAGSATPRRRHRRAA